MMKIKLFCFPYAAGSAKTFLKWQRYLNDRYIELRPVELAGRGTRICESSYTSIDEAVADTFSTIKSELTESPYALFGHSLGSLIVYELAHEIKEKGFPEPIHIFFSGRCAPHINNENREVSYNLPDEKFMTKILKLGGTPKEFFQNSELMEIFVPLLRRDMQISETYKYRGKKQMLNCSISVFIGTEEGVAEEDVIAWKEHTKQKCDVYYFGGDHFFINTRTDSVVKLVNIKLMKKYYLLNKEIKRSF